MKPESAQIYARRRTRIQERLGDSGLLIIPAAPEVVVGRGFEVRYRPDPDLYYLTGYREPGALLVLGPLEGDDSFTLFVRPRDPEAERWSGRRGGPESAAAEFGATTYPITEVEDRLRRRLANTETIYYPLTGIHPELDTLILETLASGRRIRQRSGRGPRTLHDPGVLLDELRLIKDPHELDLISEAATLTVETLLEVIPTIRPGRGEWEIEAAVESGYRRRHADGAAFATIIASGPNATVLHYRENDRVMRAGELVLIDTGAYRRGYNADLSRTLPISGRFTPLQRELYNAVLTAHDLALATIQPGTTIGQIHEVARRSLIESMIELGFLDGGVDEIIERELYRSYFPHQTSHWLGLDVHDVGDYARDAESRVLVPGMVLTVEPGLYLPEGDERVPEELRGTGIRIEDDVVVTTSGSRNLTARLPTSAADLEGLMA